MLHVGCVDSGVEVERFVRQELLHAQLASAAQELWGVDVDETGIESLRQHGFGNLQVGDICGVQWLAGFQRGQFDVIVASEVIEHLANPEGFLTSVKELMEPGRTELVITVPNAFGMNTLIHLLRGMEFVHPDHNYWFSYYTITNLVRKHGFEVNNLLVYSHERTDVRPSSFRKVLTQYREFLAGPPALPRRALARFLYKRSPFWGDGIIVVVGLSAV